MIKKLKFESVNIGSSNYNRVKKLYYEAFPKHERFPLWFLLLRSRKKGIDFFAIFDKNIFIGFCYLVTKKDLTYVLYLAIDKAKRGEGYGSHSLNAIRSFKEKNRIFLDIESPMKSSDNYKQRLKRKKFYFKNGYELAEFKIIEMGETFEILSYGVKKVKKAEYFNILKSFFSPFFTPFLKYFVKFV